MKVLRNQHESLITIVEVFIHDPLYKWALSPFKALEIQREDEEELDEVSVDSNDVNNNNNNNHNNNNIQVLKYQRKKKKRKETIIFIINIL